MSALSRLKLDNDTKEKDLKSKYQKATRNLTFCNRTLIAKLTTLAEENKDYAEVIIDSIDDYLENIRDAPMKLPVLHLINSIITYESTKVSYLQLFEERIHRLWTNVLYAPSCNENIKRELIEMKNSWIGLLTEETLAALENSSVVSSPAMHVNAEHNSSKGSNDTDEKSEKCKLKDKSEKGKLKDFEEYVTTASQLTSFAS